MYLDCNYCAVRLDDFKKYIFHLEIVHKISNYFVCPLQNCKRTYDKKNRFKSHLIACHSSNLVETLHDCPANTQHSHDSCANSEPISTPLEDNCNLHETAKQLETSCNAKNYKCFKKHIQSRLEIFLCELYSIVNIPRSFVQTFVELVQSLINDIAVSIHDITSNDFIEVSERISDVQNISLVLQTIFKEFDTEFKRSNYFTKKEFYTAPIEVKVGTTKKRNIENNKITMGLQERRSYITPLRIVLKKFIELPGVCFEILDYQKMLLNEMNNSDNKIIRNIIQGTLWNDIIKEKDKNDNYIPLILYFDEFESGNAVGSHAGEYKLGAVYVSIATIPPEKSSRLENIFLTQLFYSKDKNLFGNTIIFKKIIEELKFLEEVGISIQLQDQSITVKFILLTLSGDNLGLHSILGLFESFMATNFCRFCLTTKTESETQTTVTDNLRSLVDYDDDVHNRVGIKEKCIWNDLPNFHVYTNVTCDVMHDLTEGVQRYGMALVIKSLIGKGYFSLTRLNSRIKYFNYNTSEKNKPPPINDKHLTNNSIIMSASEMLCLTRNLIFIVGDLVEENDPIWNYYLILFEITNILTSQSFTLELLDYLKGLIEEHHKLYLFLFESKLKPKHHFLIHYPTIIKKIGPPILVSAFKYEAKHKELKKVCQSITSRRNLPLSVMKRCQLQQGFRYAINKGLTDDLTYGKFSEFEGHIGVDRCKFNGIEYNVNNVLLRSITDDIPEYYLIRKIILNQGNKEILFDCFNLQIVSYSHHLRAYKVNKTARSKIIAYRDLYTNISSVMYTVKSELYVKVDF